MSATTPKPWKGPGMEGWVVRWYTRTRKNDLEDFRRRAAGVFNPGPIGFELHLANAVCSTAPQN